MLFVLLSALGWHGTVQWLLNGRLQGSRAGATSILLTLPQAGDYRVTVLAADGAFATLALHVAG
jgi:penicillin-binding protein 1C